MNKKRFTFSVDMKTAERYERYKKLSDFPELVRSLVDTLTGFVEKQGG